MIPAAASSTNSCQDLEATLHVLTLTPFYPLADDDASGCFVSEPLPWLEKTGVVHTVLAVRPFYRGRSHPNSSAPAARWIHYFTLPAGIGLPTAGAFLYARILGLVRQLHQSQRIDVIHAHAPLPCGHAAALLSRELGIPFVVSVHGLDAFSTNQVKGRAGEWCRRVSQMVFRSSRRVICVSQHVSEEVLRGAGPACRTSVIHNGVDPEMFFSASEGPRESHTILSIGNLIPTKGHELLLRAVAAVKEQHPGLSCEIIGDGPERSRLPALAQQLGMAGRVRFLGRQSRRQVADALRHCTLFALPSRYEGLGCVYLEAMATGKPAIGCRGQGIEEIIQHGVNGWLIAPDSAQELTQGVSLLLQSEPLREQIGGAARYTVLQALTLAHQAERLHRIYRECQA